jgi:hypothetical protein
MFRGYSSKGEIALPADAAVASYLPHIEVISVAK